MRPTDLLEYVKAEPFRPFRLRLTNGTSYEIRHPELIKVGRSSALVFFHRGDQPQDLLLRYDSVALIHINSIEHLDASPSQAAGSMEEQV